MCRKLLVITLSLILITSLAGCKGNNQEELDDAVISEEEAKDLAESMPEFDDSEIIYDLITAVDSNRKIEELDEYPAHTLLSVMVSDGHEQGNDANSTDENTNDNSVNSSAESKETPVYYTNHDTVERFLEDTNTGTNDYKDFYVAHYPESHYTIGIVVPSDNSGELLMKMKSYKQTLFDTADENMREYYNNSVIKEVNNCILISVTDDNEENISNMESYISAVYALLRDSHDSISNDAGDIINEIEDTENIYNENDMDSDGDED